MAGHGSHVRAILRAVLNPLKEEACSSFTPLTAVDRQYYRTHVSYASLEKSFGRRGQLLAQESFHTYGAGGVYAPGQAQLFVQDRNVDTWKYSRQYRTSISSLQDKLSSREPVSTREDTDRIVEELRYRNIKVPSQLNITWRRRVEGLLKYGYGALKATVNFFLAIPSTLYRASRMSMSEWRDTLKGWWITLKHEAHHYWGGFKLFGFELQVASRLVWKKLQGVQLSRRERRQLTRTSADIFRVVPFSLFIIIPFAEVLLPVALRIFPNMLPSTFETQLKQEEDMKKLLKLKTELAGFLQQTVAELAKDVKRSTSGEVADEAKALTTFLSDVRDGRTVSNADIVKFARLFNDELTLDSLDRVHLITLCQTNIRPLLQAMGSKGASEALQSRITGT